MALWMAVLVRWRAARMTVMKSPDCFGLRMMVICYWVEVA
jgi:hypothetical protein